MRISNIKSLRISTCAFFTCALQAIGATPINWIADLQVTSRVDFVVADYPVSVSLADLAVTAAESAELTVHANDEGVPVAVQLLDSNRDGQMDQLFFLAALDGGQTRSFTVFRDAEAARVAAYPRRAQAEISQKTGGKWEGSKYVGGEFRNVHTLQPPAQYTDHSFYIRYEGPGWESDKIGYRFYLDWRNGFDVFGKRTNAMVLQDVGLDGYDSYHEPAEWGMDVLKVGSAVGLGGYGAWVDGKIERVSEVETRRSTVVANGPLYAAHLVEYEGWKTDGKSHELTARLGIAGGSYLTQVDLNIEPSRHMATGIVKLPEGELIHGPDDIPEKDFTWLATYGKQSIIGDELGMVIFYRLGDQIALQSDEHNHGVVLRARDGAVSYFFGSVWAQDPNVKWNRALFEKYLQETALLLNRPAYVRIENRQDRILKSAELSADEVKAWTMRVADGQLTLRGDSLAFGRYDPESGAMARWRYTTGLLAMGFEELWRLTSERRYWKFNETIMGSFVKEDGSIETYRPDEYNIDHINPGKQLIGLYQVTGEEKYRKAADRLWQQLQTHPRTEAGGFWHKKVYPWQMWLDGLYMGAPFYAEYATVFAKPEVFSDIAKQFVLMNEVGRHPENGWLYHAYDEKRQQPWADKKTGLSSEIWSRALGWYAMALVDTLEFLPQGSAEAQALLDILPVVAKQILEFQDANSGMWYQVMDKAGETGNYPETSGSSMFVYALAKAINRGWLEGENYSVAAIKGFNGLVQHAVKVDADGTCTLDYICEVAGLSDVRDGSFGYYMSEPIVKHDSKGTGPFLLAGIEVYQLFLNN